MAFGVLVHLKSVTESPDVLTLILCGVNLLVLFLAYVSVTWLAPRLYTGSITAHRLFL